MTKIHAVALCKRDAQLSRVDALLFVCASQLLSSHNIFRIEKCVACHGVIHCLTQPRRPEGRRGFLDHVRHSSADATLVLNKSLKLKLMSRVAIRQNDFW